MASEQNEQAKQENQPETPSYSDRVTDIKEQARKKVFERKGEAKTAKVALSDAEAKLGGRMLPLLASDGFKALQEFENFQIQDAIGKSFQPPPDSWFSPAATFGEKMAYKQGYIVGMQILRLAREGLLKSILEGQASEAKGEEK